MTGNGVNGNDPPGVYTKGWYTAETNEIIWLALDGDWIKMSRMNADDFTYVSQRHFSADNCATGDIRTCVPNAVTAFRLWAGASSTERSTNGYVVPESSMVCLDSK